MTYQAWGGGNLCVRVFVRLHVACTLRFPLSFRSACPFLLSGTGRAETGLTGKFRRGFPRGPLLARCLLCSQVRRRPSLGRVPKKSPLYRLSAVIVLLLLRDRPKNARDGCPCGHRRRWRRLPPRSRALRAHERVRRACPWRRGPGGRHCPRARSARSSRGASCSPSCPCGGP